MLKLQRNRIIAHSDKVSRDAEGNYYHDDVEIIWARNDKHIPLCRIKTARWWRPEGLISSEDFTTLVKALPVELLARMNEGNA